VFFEVFGEGEGVGEQVLIGVSGVVGVYDGWFCAVGEGGLDEGKVGDFESGEWVMEERAEEEVWFS